MVATVLRLRYRVLGNTLARRPWQLVGFCLGALWGLGAVTMVLWGIVALAVFGDPALTRSIMILGGSVLLIGWVLGPLLIAGLDETVDAAKLAPLPLSRRQVMQALAGVTLTGIPGILTTLVALLSAIAWVRWPVAAIVAVPAAALAVLTCVLACRLMSTLSQGVGGNRRGREITGTIVLALLIMSGPILTGILSLVGAAGDAPSVFAVAADVLGWTPLAAAWAGPADLALGAGGSGAAKLAIAAATVAVLWVVWERALAASIASPPHRAARAVKPGALGLFGIMPTGAVCATWARALTQWLRDPRYLRQLIFVPLFPIVFAFAGGIDGFLFLGSPLLVALILAIAGYADVSYDDTAFASVLSSGASGRADRAGRALGAATVGVPAIVLVSVVVAIIAGRVDLLLPVLAGALALLLAGYAVSAVSSALLVVPVAAPGDSPFKSVPGQTFVSGLLVFVVMATALVLALPAGAVAIAAVVGGSALVGGVALVVAVVVGGAAVVAGVLIGGRTLERTGPDLLVRIKAFPT